MAYSQEDVNRIFDWIISNIESGLSLRQTMKLDGMPHVDTFYEWIDKDKEKSERYARAIEIRADLKFESIERDYLEEPQRDPQTGRIDPAWVNLQRLKIDAKKWELSKMLPKKYGDRLELENKHSGSVNIISLGSGQKPNESDN